MKYFLIAVFVVIGFVTPAYAQGPPTELYEVPFWNFIDRNDNAVYDVGIDTHIRWGGFNYAVFSPTGEVIEEATFWMLNYDYFVLYLADQEVVSISRVGSCEPAWVWTYETPGDNIIIMVEWEELDQSCDNPVVPFETYTVFIPVVVSR